MIGITVLMLAAALQPWGQSGVGIGNGAQFPGQELNGVAVPKKSELKALLRNARTADDQKRIAAWYWKEAQHFAKIAQDNAQLANEYANRTRFEPNANYPEGTLRHCRDLARLYAQKAETARRVAIEHEQMATTLQASR